jgi:hypothetical protein
MLRVSLALGKFAVVLLVVGAWACDSKQRDFGKGPSDGSAQGHPSADSTAAFKDSGVPARDSGSDAASEGVFVEGGTPDSGHPDGALSSVIASNVPDAASVRDTGPHAVPSAIADSGGGIDTQPDASPRDSSDGPDAPEPCAVGSHRVCGGCGLETCDESGAWSECIAQSVPTCLEPTTALTCGEDGEWLVEACSGPSECLSGSCLNVFHGDAVLVAASDVATYSQYDVIDGNLQIDIPAELGAVVELPRLKVVRGDVTLVYNGVEHATNVVTTRCGVSEEAASYIVPLNLTALETVEGSLTLYQAGYFRYPFSGGFGTAYVDFGLGALSVLGGDLSLEVELAGSKACGLPALTIAPGNVTIDYGRHEMFAGGDPLLPALTEIAGALEIKGATYGVPCPDVLPALSYAGGLSVTDEGTLGSGLASFPLASLTDVAGLAIFQGPNTQNSAGALLRVGHLHLIDLPDLERIGGATLDLGGLTMNGGYFSQPADSKLTLTPLATVELSDMLSVEDACAFIAYHRARGWQEDLVIDGLPISCQ